MGKCSDVDLVIREKMKDFFKRYMFEDFSLNNIPAIDIDSLKVDYVECRVCWNDKEGTRNMILIYDDGDVFNYKVINCDNNKQIN